MNRQRWTFTFTCGHKDVVVSEHPPTTFDSWSRTTVCDDCARKLRETERSKTVTEENSK